MCEARSMNQHVGSEPSPLVEDGDGACGFFLALSTPEKVWKLLVVSVDVHAAKCAVWWCGLWR